MKYLMKLSSVLLFLILLFGCKFPINNYFTYYNEFMVQEEESEMAIDWNESANDCDLVTSSTGGCAGVANPANAHDGDDETYSQCSSTDGVGEGIWTFTFAGARNIEEFKFRVKGYVGGSPPPSYSVITFEYYDGSWHALAEDVQLTDTATWYTYSAGYLNVTKVRVTGTCWFAAGEPPKRSISYLYTATANGDVFASGLKIQTSGGVVQIAGETLLTAVHKLRLKKTSGVVGIPLVGTGDSWASPVRIYDGSGVKALMKM